MFLYPSSLKFLLLKAPIAQLVERLTVIAPFLWKEKALGFKRNP